MNLDLHEVARRLEHLAAELHQFALVLGREPRPAPVDIGALMQAILDVLKTAPVPLPSGIIGKLIDRKADSFLRKALSDLKKQGTILNVYRPARGYWLASRQEELPVSPPPVHVNAPMADALLPAGPVVPEDEPEDPRLMFDPARGWNEEEERPLTDEEVMERLAASAERRKAS